MNCEGLALYHPHVRRHRCYSRIGQHVRHQIRFATQVDRRRELPALANRYRGKKYPRAAIKKIY
jgi:hypothetical protein